MSKQKTAKERTRALDDETTEPGHLRLGDEQKSDASDRREDLAS